MLFEDLDVDKLDPTTQAGLKGLLEHLCGESVALGCHKAIPCGNCQACMNWAVLSTRIGSSTLSLEDLNDILLLVDQFPIGSDFYDFFLSSGEKAITFEELKQGIVRFKGFAVLKYGNVRFAYRALNKLSKSDLAHELGRWHTDTALLKKQYGARRNAPLMPLSIPSEKTWLLGYIAKGGADRDLVTYALWQLYQVPKMRPRYCTDLNSMMSNGNCMTRGSPFSLQVPLGKTRFRVFLLSSPKSQPWSPR
jgi:hypothetical protein